MARMYPRTILDTELNTGSERKVFDRLEAGLSDDWEVFHSSAWIDRDPGDGARFGEIDFVLCHPEQAIVCLEVKGGGIECRHGEWFRVEVGGEPQRIRDSFAQASDHKFALERLLRDANAFDGSKPFVVHAVVFPYVTIHQLALAPDAPREILIDRHELASPAEAIERVLSFHRGAREKRVAAGEDGAAALRELLAPTVSISVPMAAQFLDEEEALVQLTHEQSLLLRRLRNFRRMVIRGCAGSGKTMLAVEHAKRLAADGKRVAFVCFNRALRDHLRTTSAVQGVHLNTFHGLCMYLAKKGRVELATYDGDAPPEFWVSQLPDAMVEAVGELGDQFDALIVDEAQDLANDWLAALMCTLGDEKESPVWLYMDDNQTVYDPRLEVPVEFEAFDLTVNCRNTQAIHREVMKLYEGEIEPEVRGPEGRQPEFLAAEDQATAVAEVLERLCGKEEVAPQDVVVLSSHGFDRSQVAADLPGRWRPTKERGKLGDNVFVSSIRSFKGLESPVVVLCELGDIDDMTQNQQLYVAMSRARNHVVVVAPA